LLAAGHERIYQVCKCFRAGEHGPHHASEFTMIEWYRAFAELDDIARDTEHLVAAVVRALAAAPTRGDTASDDAATSGGGMGGAGIGGERSDGSGTEVRPRRR